MLVPAGSTWGGPGGDEWAEALQEMARIKRVSGPCGLQRAVNAEQAPKKPTWEPTRHNNGAGSLRRWRGERCDLRSPRGSGGSTHGIDSTCNKGSLPMALRANGATACPRGMTSAAADDGWARSSDETA